MGVFKSTVYRKYVLIFVLFGVIISLVSSALSYWLFTGYNSENVDQKISFQLERSKSAATYFIRGVENNATTLAQSAEISEYIESLTRSSLNHLERLTLSLIKTNSSIYQIRFINNQGDEIVKVKATRDDQGVVNYRIEPIASLQNKSRRYYFQVSKELSSGRYYVSHLDLNVENGVIEIPYRPTLRIVTPVRGEQNQYLGAIVINMDASYMLSILTSFEGLDAYLVDKDGYIVFSNNSEFNWSRYLGKNAFSRDVIDMTVEEIKASQHLNVSDLLGNDEELRLFVTASEELASASGMQTIKSSLLLVLVVVAAAIPLGMLLAYSPSRNSDKLAKLSKENDLYSKIVDQHIPILDTDLQGTVTRINDAMCNLSGYRRQDVIGRSSSLFQHHDTEPKDFADMWRSLADGQSWTGEFHNKRRDGVSFWLNSHISPRLDSKGKKVGYISVSSDISDRKTLETISEKDALTGLYNRSKINEVLDSEYKRSERYLTPFSILIIDVDHFKSVNDTFGHLVGDSVLREISNLLRYNVRQTDCVGRWGGEEFVVICPQTELDGGVAVAEKLRKSIEQFNFEDVKKVTVSIGVSAFEKGYDIQQILEIADKNLYRAKAAGRNRVVSHLEKYSVVEFPKESKTK